MGLFAGNAAAGACRDAPARAATLDPLAKGEVAAFLPADGGVDLTGLAFFDGDGAPISLADFRGRTVLVNLWATWCVPCRTEMPALDRLQRAAGDAGFEVVAVNIDQGDRGRPDAFLEEEAIDSLRRFYDPATATFRSLRAEGLAFGLPTTLLLDREGCLLGALHGPAEWDSADARMLIQSAKAL